MKNTTKTLPLLLALALLASCNPAGTSSGATSGTSSESSSGSESQAVTLEDGPLGELRKSQGRVSMGSIGTAKLAIIPVVFADDETVSGSTISFSYTSEQLTNLDTIHFGSRQSTFRPTAKDFYEASSYGKFHLDGDVLPEVKLPSRFQDYVQAVATRGTADVISEIADYVIDAAFGEGKTDPSLYDNDGDGLIDGVTLAYNFAAPFLSWLVENSNYVTPAVSLLVDGLLTPSLVPEGVGSLYWMSGSYDIDALFYEGVTSNVSAPAAYLEIAQLLGLDGLGDTTGDIEGNYRLPLGYTDLMDSGMLDHNPFSKYMLGWIEPTVITADSLAADESKSFTLGASSQAGDALLLAPSATGIYDEYLLVDHYEPTGIDSFDSDETLAEGGIRIYKVDARLVRGSTTYALYEGEPDYEATTTDALGNTVPYTYDFAYTNDYANHYVSSGIVNSFPLVTILDRDGSNRHMANQIQVTSDDLFKVGDTFGAESEIPGFYEDYRFNGNGSDGEFLGLTLTVDSMNEESASVSIRRA